MTLQGLEETWNVNHHMMWGGFDRAEKCQVRQTRAQPRIGFCCFWTRWIDFWFWNWSWSNPIRLEFGMESVHIHADNWSWKILINFPFEFYWPLSTQNRLDRDPCIRPDACCGEPEHRFPYSSFDGMRGCCEQKTFWKPESCCKGGKVLSKDQCPEDSEDKEGFTHREMTKV